MRDLDTPLNRLLLILIHYVCSGSRPTRIIKRRWKAPRKMINKKDKENGKEKSSQEEKTL